MTDDIVTQLRLHALEGCSVADWTRLSYDIQVAADEIERLRKELGIYQDLYATEIVKRVAGE